MLTLPRLVITLSLTLLLFSTVFTQEPQTPSIPLVTAIAGSQRVRYISAGEVKQTRLQVFSKDGTQVFDSDFKLGNLIDWTLSNQQGQHLADGSFLFLITVKDFSDRLTQKYGTIVLEQGRVYLEQTDKTELPQAQAAALESNKESKFLSPIDRIGADGLNPSLPLTASNPTTDAQTSTTIESSGLTNGGNNITAESTGTENSIAKWLDDAGNLGDSTISETGGKVGIGTSNAALTLDVNGSVRGGQLVLARGFAPVEKGGYLFAGTGGAGPLDTEMGFFAANDGTNGGANEGPYLTARGNNFSRIPNQRGSLVLVAGSGFPLPNAGEGEIKLVTGDVERLKITYAGNVGIGTTNPGARLEVDGNLRVSGAGNGLIFPDGTKQMTAGGVGGGGGGGSGGVGGSGTPNSIPVWTGETTLGNSLITQSANGVQLPNGVQLAAGLQGNAVAFGSPNGETGMSISGTSGRADLRFGPNASGTDAILKLVVRPPGSGPPSETNGIAITTAGNVGIGTASPNFKLHVNGGFLTGVYGIGDPGVTGQGSSDRSIGVKGYSASFSGVYGDTDTGTGVYGHAFSASGYAGRFDGLVLVNDYLDINYYTSGGTATVCRLGARLAVCSSSLRYKTNIAPFLGGLDLIHRLRPISYTWKSDGSRDLGLGAEEVASVEPLLVTHNERGEVEGVKYEHLNVVLINAIKEQQTQLQQQQKLIKQLQAQLNQVKRTIRRRR